MSEIIGLCNLVQLTEVEKIHPTSYQVGKPIEVGKYSVIKFTVL